MSTTRVVIVGGGFAGLNAAKGLRRAKDVEITLIDKRNHHLFQPLLYQVAMAGLSPADIAAPIRGILSKQNNVRVLQADVIGVDFDDRTVQAARPVLSSRVGVQASACPTVREKDSERTTGNLKVELQQESAGVAGAGRSVAEEAPAGASTVPDRDFTPDGRSSPGHPTPEQEPPREFDTIPFDYLILACGATHSYFGRDEWEEHAPGLKTVEQATEIRRRVLTAFEQAEREADPEVRKRLLTFIVVGGGPTGVELAGAIGEMSRFTLARDFRNIDAKLARVILIEGGPRILPMFHEKLTARATRDLEQLGVQVWTNSIVTQVDAGGVEVGEERIRAGTVLWAAGVKAATLGEKLGVETDKQGRIVVEPDLSVKGHPNVFVAGDQARFEQNDKPLPGVAPVAMQQGRYLAKLILREVKSRLSLRESTSFRGAKDDDAPPRPPFRYKDKGQMATIGRSRAITQVGRFKFAGFFAWIVWLVVHIYYLTGFRNRLFVVINWAWSYLTFRRGARLIVEKEWRQNRHESATQHKPEAQAKA